MYDNVCRLLVQLLKDCRRYNFDPSELTKSKVFQQVHVWCETILNQISSFVNNYYLTISKFEQ